MKRLALVLMLTLALEALADEVEGQSEPFKQGFGVQCADGKWYRKCPEKRAADAAGEKKWDETEFPRVRSSASSSQEIPRTEHRMWYVGGTLHKSSVEEWKRGTPDNRLATSSDFAAAILKGQFASMEELKYHAEQLEICISGSVKDVKMENQPVGDIAAACAVLMGWKLRS